MFKSKYVTHSYVQGVIQKYTEGSGSQGSLSMGKDPGKLDGIASTVVKKDSNIQRHSTIF